MTIHEEIQELIPAYVLGACEADEAARVERHVASCTQCGHVLDEYQPAASQLAFAVPRIAPPPDLKYRTIEHALAAGKESSRPSLPAARRASWLERLGLGSILLGAATVAAVLAIAFGLWQVNRLNDELARQRDMMTVIAYAQGQAVTVRGTSAAPGATGRLYADPDSQTAALITTNMPPVPADRVYQLWLTEPNGKKISGGLFTADAEGTGYLLIRTPQQLSAYSLVGVTVEPRGGSPGPTTKPVLQAPLNQ
ncbi:MAG: anti-sigma factor domain-containing protein [Rudaea sp.]